MLRGRAMTVWRRELGGTDAMGEDTVVWVPETVENVLWGPTRSESLSVVAGGLDAGGRTRGTRDTITAHFPKTYTESLSGCRLEAYGRCWDVIGDPQPHLDHLAPGRWNRTVVARRVDG